MTPAVGSQTSEPYSRARLAGSASILAVDDQPELLRTVDEILAERYQCDCVASVEEARRKLSESSYELCICGIQMPDESGLVLVEEIARDYPHTAIVMVTGFDDPAVVERASELRAHGYLIKPFPPGQLLITTLNALRRRELEIEQEAHSRSLEDRLQAIIDRAPMPIYAKDRSNRYIIANRRAREFVQLTNGNLVGQTDEAIMPPESARRARITDQLVLEEGVTFEEEQTLTIGTEERVYLTVKFPLFDDEGRISAVCGISPDVTAAKREVQLRDELTRAQQQAIDELRSSRLETVERLTKAIELHDHSTGEHVNRMAEIASFLGREYGLDEDRVELLRAAAPMHDVGKIGTPEEILVKPGALTPEEREEMQRHTQTGHDLLALSESELLRLAAVIALTHHEHFDGSGYPQGLAGEEIPIEGRLVAVADVFDALLSDRSYRPAMSVAEAVEVIKEGRGSHFDPQIADALLEHLEEALSLRG